MCCIGFGRSPDVLPQWLEVEQCWRRLKNEPITANGRREDYVRLPFVDDLCLRCAMQDFLRRKPSSKAKLTERLTNQIVLMSTMSYLEWSLLLLIEGLSITSEVFTWMPFRGTHIKIWWRPHECPRIIRPNSILVNTSQDNILFLLLQRWNCVVDWSRRFPTLTICKRSSLWCVDCPMLP